MPEKEVLDSVTRRSSFRKALSDAALPPDYLEKLEQKRKQLDDSIHKYIAAKEREYKQFEKEVKQQHKESQGHDGLLDTGRRRASPQLAPQDKKPSKVDSPKMTAVDALLATSTAQSADGGTSSAEQGTPPNGDNNELSGLKHRGAGAERDKDFVGLFTPGYLQALQASEAPPLERATSDPQNVNQADGEQNGAAMERANSDSGVQAKLKRPSQLFLSQRTSSSGSSADGRLTSAMKSPTQRGKQKRVSLAVGDSIVAPSDSVPTMLSFNRTPSHSITRALQPDLANPISTKRPTVTSVPDGMDVNAPLPEAFGVESTTGQITDNMEQGPLPAQADELDMVDNTSNSSKIDADGDLFDLDEDSDTPHNHYEALDEDEDFENALESDDEITGRTEGEIDQIDASTGRESVRYDPETGNIPEPANGKDSAVPSLAFGPGSSVASQQPTRPGFRRPSVILDPIYGGRNYQAAEEDAVENEVYGSSYTRPTKGSFTAGSLGESYMAQHAEEMRLRSSRQEAQVRS